MDGEAYLDDVRRELRRLKSLADGALAQIGPQDLFSGAGAESNPLAVIVKHLAGNMRSRWRDFLTSDGEKPDRDRDGEFELDAADTAEALAERWEEGWRTLFAAVDPLTAADLGAAVMIRGEPHTVLQALQRQLSHYAYHTGQIVYRAREIAGESWRSLSIPKGGSERFNAAPDRYLR